MLNSIKRYWMQWKTNNRIAAAIHEPIPLFYGLSAAQVAKSIGVHSIRPIDVVNAMPEIQKVLPVDSREPTTDIHNMVPTADQATKIFPTFRAVVSNGDSNTVIAQNALLLRLQVHSQFNERVWSTTNWNRERAEVIYLLDKYGWTNGVRFVLAVTEMDSFSPHWWIMNSAWFREAIAVGVDNESVDYVLQCLDVLAAGTPASVIRTGKEQGLDPSLISSLIVGGR